MCVRTRSLRDGYLFFIVTYGAGKDYNAIIGVRGFTLDLTLTKGMCALIELRIATVAAHCPMRVLVEFYFSRIFYAVLSFGAVVGPPLRTMDTDFVTASVRLGNVSTAILAKSAVLADIRAIFADFAVGTDCNTVGAISALLTRHIGAVRAPIAVLAHSVCAIDASAALGTDLAHTFGAKPAILASHIRTVHTYRAAILADFCTVSASIAIFAPHILAGTFTAQITRYAELVVARGTFLAAVGAEVSAILASLTARAGHSTVTA